jgi:peptide/nickel transport system substrate-binding protein/microcin C transport system substrate-binding protein
VQAPWVHGYASYGEPKYPRGFDHFGYVNPTAPKGGTLYLRNPDRRSSFDKFNPFTITGNAPAALMLFVIEPLAVMAGDEPQTMYGVLAEEMQVAPDKSSMSFRIHPKARFQNGDPVTAADVKYSYESLASKYAAPAYQTALAGVEKATVIDERTIRFDLKDRSNDMVFTLGGLRVFSRKWALGPDGQPKRFDQIVTEYPIASGPYRIDVAASGRRLELKRNPDYWAATSARGAASSTSTASSTATTRTRRSRARPSRPASSTSSRSTAHAAGCASTRARSGTTGASRRTCSRRQSARACSRTS